MERVLSYQQLCPPQRRPQGLPLPCLRRLPKNDRIPPPTTRHLSLLDQAAPCQDGKHIRDVSRASPDSKRVAVSLGCHLSCPCSVLGSPSADTDADRCDCDCNCRSEASFKRHPETIGALETVRLVRYQENPANWGPGKKASSSKPDLKRKRSTEVLEEPPAKH